MTNQEINEYLEEHLFGLKKTIKTKAGWLFRIGLNCGEITAPDYTDNYQPVLERLLETAKAVKVEKYGPEQKVCQILEHGLYPFPTGIGINTGIAICRAAVEYLKARGNEE